METETSLREKYQSFLGKSVVIHRLSNFGVEPFFAKCRGVVDVIETSYMVIRRTDMSDNGRPIFIAFKYADFHMKDYTIAVKD